MLNISILANLYFLLENHPHCCPLCLEELPGVDGGQAVVHEKQLEHWPQLTLFNVKNPGRYINGSQLADSRASGGLGSEGAAGAPKQAS